MVLVDITTNSAIGKHDYRVVRPDARRLNLTNTRARSRYIAHLEAQMVIHWLPERLSACGQAITSFPTAASNKALMQKLDTQTEEMQRGSEARCRQLFSTAMPFSEPVRTYHYRRRAYQGLLNVLEKRTRNASNAYRDALHCGIPSPQLLDAAQCRDGVEACARHLQSLKRQLVGLQKVHLRDSYIRAQECRDEDKCKDILRIIGREEQKSMWRRINRVLDKPSLGAIPFVQRVENGVVVDITDTDEMNREIQSFTEKQFDLSMSAPITMSSLRAHLGFLSNTDFANSLLAGDAHIPWDIDDSRGFGSRIISPISGVVIDFLGEIYVDDTDLIVTHPDLDNPTAVLERLHSSAEAWTAALNSTGGAINPDKSRWILASYEWVNGIWHYGQQPAAAMTIPLPDGSRAPISNGDVTTAEKSLGVWSGIDGNDSKHIEENVTGKMTGGSTK
ncbi:hypothetical protein ACHAW5_007971 [Stephanodiscus triporus]|uniref:Uncharacterized protein n=1 Tax=Stephanodiscus triporus TaxID=2934178 RepID=A0ABD3MZ73_9STRA